jgi:translation initiation factor 6 (eIF-6)
VPLFQLRHFRVSLAGMTAVEVAIVITSAGCLCCVYTVRNKLHPLNLLHTVRPEPVEGPPRSGAQTVRFVLVVRPFILRQAQDERMKERRQIT